MTTRLERQARLIELGAYVFKRYQHAAARAVYSAVKDGRVPPPSTLVCVDCGQQADEYDHRDYAHPLVIAPVCTSCNHRRGMAAVDLERVRLDCSPYWAEGSVESYLRLTDPDNAEESLAELAADEALAECRTQSPADVQAQHLGEFGKS